MDNSEGGVGFPARVGIGLHAAPRLPRVVGVSRMFERGWPLPSRVGVLDQGAARAAEGEGVVKRVAWAVGAVVVPLVLGVTVVGCTTQQPGPIPTSSVVATPTTSSTSSTQPPTTANDDDAAIAALRAYFDAFNRALGTLDPTPMMKAAGPACSVCEADAAKLTRDRAAGRTYTGGAQTVSEIQIVQKKDPDHFLLTARVTTEAMTIRDGAGGVVDEFKATSGPKAFVMSRIANQWRLDAVG